MPIDVEGDEVHAPAVSHAASGVKGALTKRLGPLPVWAWGGIAVAGLFVVVPLLRAQSGAAASGTGAAVGNGAGGGGSVLPDVGSLPPGDTGSGGSYLPPVTTPPTQSPGGSDTGTGGVAVAPAGVSAPVTDYPFQPNTSPGYGAGSGIQQTSPSTAIITSVDPFPTSPGPSGGTNTAPLPGVFTGNSENVAAQEASYNGVIANEAPAAGATTAYDLGQFAAIEQQQAAAKQ